MKKVFLILTLALIATASWGQQHFAVGVFNGWAPAQPANEMLDNGVAPDAAAGDGIFTVTVADATAGEREIKTTGPAGWGDNEVPGSGNFIYELAAPGNVTLYLDTNSAGDGWQPDSNRLSTDQPYTAFTTVHVTGNWIAAAGLGNDWDPNTAPQLVDDGSDVNDTAGDGVYTLTVNIPAAGSYEWKGLLDAPTDGWNRAFAEVGFTTAGGNLGFSTSVPNGVVILEIDTNAFLARSTVTGGSLPFLPFTDDFNADTSADYTVLMQDEFNTTPGTEDALVTFAYDYSTFVGADTAATTIPVAPNTADASTVGLRIDVNLVDDTTGDEGVGVNLYPLGIDIPAGTNYRMTLDAFVMYNGDAFGGVGSTEELLAGLNMSATRANWHFGTDTDGIWVNATGEAGDAPDYGLWNGVNAAAPVNRPAADGFHTLGDDNAAQVTGVPYDVYFPNPPFETVGGIGKEWVEVEITYINDTMSWRINGNSMVTYPNDTTFTSGFPMIGYADNYNSVAATVSDNFIVIDNLLIEEIIQTAVDSYALYR